MSVKLPSRPASYDRLSLLAEEMCLHTGILRFRESVKNIEGKLVGNPSPYLQTHWEAMQQRKLVPKGWEDWVSSGKYVSDQNVPPEEAAGYLLGSVRDVVEAIDLWNQAREYATGVFDIGPFPVLRAVKTPMKAMVEPPWLSSFERIAMGLRKDEPVEGQMYWSDEMVRRIYGVVGRWELARREGDVATICPLYPIAALLTLGFGLGDEEIWVPCGHLR